MIYTSDYQAYPPAQWPAEIHALPVRIHPDGRRLVNFADVGKLLGISPSGVRERRRQKRLPGIAFRDGNRTFCEIGPLADAYLDEHPEKIIPLPPPPVKETTDATEVADVEPSDGARNVRQQQRQSEALTDGIEAVRNLLEQIAGWGRESDGQVSALTETVAVQARIIEGLRQELAAKDAEIGRLREASEARQIGVWGRLTGRRK